MGYGTELFLQSPPRKFCTSWNPSSLRDSNWNSIAHSQYSILGRHIQLNNYIAEDPYSQLKVLPFDEWIDRFHETLVIYTLYREFLERVNDNYGELAMQNNKMLQIRISRKDPEEKVEFGVLHYREFFKDWGPQPDR